MPATFKLEIVTPEAKIFSDDVEMITLPGIEGEMGVFPQHVPLMTQVVPGQLVIRRNGQDQLFAVGEGFAEITADRVAILTDLAIDSTDMDDARLQEARKRAEARLAERYNDEDAARVNAALAQSLAQIRGKRRQKN